MDIHSRQGRIAAALKRLEKRLDITDANKATIKRMMDFNYARGLSAGRVWKYLITLPNIAAWLGKDFELVTRDDVQHVVGEIERKTWTAWTKHDYKAILKYFFRWFRNAEEYPSEVRWIKTTAHGTTRKLPEDMLTQEEITRLIYAATNPRDRAFIATLAESGCRVGEIGGMRIKDVLFDKNGAVLIVDGKTGMRRVRIVAAAPFLAAWIGAHPKALDREAWLWNNKMTGEFLGYRGIWKMMKDVRERAGIAKKTNCHNFRHSRASMLANYLTSAQMNAFFGWAQSSKMSAVYVHLSGRDVDSALLGAYGMVPEGNKNELLIKPKICSECGTWNEFTNIMCKKCGQLLQSESSDEEEIEVEV